MFSTFFFFSSEKQRYSNILRSRHIQPSHCSVADSHAFHDSNITYGSIKYITYGTSHTVVLNTSRRQTPHLSMIPDQELASQVMEAAQEWVTVT